MVAIKPQRDLVRWTPVRGLMRAAVFGSAVATVLAVLVGILAAYAPMLVMDAYCCTAVTVIVGCCLFGAVQSAAGMVGKYCTAMAIGYAVLVMHTRNAVWAVVGVHAGRHYELVKGWDIWFDPVVLGMGFFFPALGLVFCSWLCRDGAPGSGVFSHVLSMRVTRIN